MAYQNTGTPRFWVSTLQWLAYMGRLTEYGSTNQPESLSDKPIYDLVYIDPIKQLTWQAATPSANGVFLLGWKITNKNFSDYMPNDNNFYMMLGHTLKNTYYSVTKIGGEYEQLAGHGLVNFSNNNQATPNDGFTISIGNNAEDHIGDVLGVRFDVGDNYSNPNGFNIGEEYKMGSFLYGTFYDMPHSPDLSLTMEVEMDGINQFRSKGGFTVPNYKYLSSPLWGDYPAWELDTTDPGLRRIGRRSWDLSFSFLQESDLFTGYEGVTNYGITNDNSDGLHAYDNLLKNNDFFSQVIYKTCGGKLPFIFQPEGGAIVTGGEIDLQSSNNNPDQFAICVLDMNSFTVKRVAKKLYNCNLKIREVW